MEVVIGLIVTLALLSVPFMLIVTLAKVSRIETQVADILMKLAAADFKRRSGAEEKIDSRRAAEAQMDLASRRAADAQREGGPCFVTTADETNTSLPLSTNPVNLVNPVQNNLRVSASLRENTTPPPNHPTTTLPNYPTSPEPTAFDRFWMRVEDWLAVRGDFAPKGMTHEFAFATRWLVRVGALLLVGAIAYFLMLAIDKGWIGPVQRVFGMMAWGVAGTAFGTWLKLKSERYAILGEAVAALGLVAAYLSFGLGHRYFDPPVIASGVVAFAGLFAATLAAGFLSVRLKSLMIACLALAGGFLVPAICNFTSHDVQLHAYLFLLSLGACAVALLRGWTLYSFVAIAVALAFSQAKCGSCAMCDAAAAYAFHALEFALTLAIAVWASVRGGSAKVRPFYWLPVVLAGIFCLCRMDVIVETNCAGRGAWALNHFAWATAFAALAFFSRRRNWGGTPVLIVFSCACAVFALATACLDWWHLNAATVVLFFCLFAALLAELGARSGERTLQALALAATIAMSLTGFCRFANAVAAGGGGYAHGLIDRIQSLWPLPALVAFVGWRVDADGFWRKWLPLKPGAFVVAVVMAFAIVTAESRFFGKEFLPSLRGGFVTIVWATMASAALAAGIVKRIRVARLAGLGLLLLAVTKLLLVDTASLATPGRVGVFAAVGALLIAGAFLYLTFKSYFEEERT